jgi:hypothetical protein
MNNETTSTSDTQKRSNNEITSANDIQKRNKANRKASPSDPTSKLRPEPAEAIFTHTHTHKDDNQVELRLAAQTMPYESKSASKPISYG